MRTEGPEGFLLFPGPLAGSAGLLDRTPRILHIFLEVHKIESLTRSGLEEKGPLSPGFDTKQLCSL